MTPLENVLQRRGLLEEARRILDRHAPATFEHIIGRSHVASICQARHEIAALLAQHTGLSTPQIGRLMGGRDHTTILNSLKTMGVKSARARGERCELGPPIRYRVA
jgi:chromosomal replication initiation ATPase DnaA